MYVNPSKPIQLGKITKQNSKDKKKGSKKKGSRSSRVPRVLIT